MFRISVQKGTCARWATQGIALAAVALVLTAGSIGWAADDLDQKADPERGRLSAPVTPYAFNGDVRALPAPREWRPGDPLIEIPRRVYPIEGTLPTFPPSEMQGMDPLAQRQLDFARRAGADPTFGTPSRNIVGIGFTGATPPDPSGDVGPNHFIQSINSSIVNIYDKAEPTPNLLASFSMDSLGAGQCANGRGDPIILYDREADRWMLTEFSFNGNNLCFYISQTPDPVAGGWNNYAFAMTSFPDYPKYSVWATDANGGLGSYIATANNGPQVYAMDRTAMLAGDPASFQTFNMPGLPGWGFQAPTPADPDGPTPPPAGTPAYILQHRDTELHGPTDPSNDRIDVWEFDVDWETPANSTLTQRPSIITSEFDSNLCNGFFNCIDQPGTGGLDHVREAIMNRLQYMNHGSFETLVGNFITDVNGADRGGVRWFELRRPIGGSWSLRQEGTITGEDNNSRWMGSAAMDQSENIAVVHNVAGPATFPSLRYNGRLAGDPLGVMTQPEASIGEGGGNWNSSRYGDYQQLGLDPSDDCTFWFTGIFNPTTQWQTRIASFKFDSCGCLTAPSPVSANAIDAGENSVTVSWNDADLDSVAAYEIGRSRTPGGPYSTIASVPDSSPGIAGGSGYSYDDTTVDGTITYYYTVTATDGSACKSESAEVDVTATGLCTLRPIFAGLSGGDSALDSTCSVQLDWDAGLAECGGPLTYNVYRSTTPGFTPSPANLLAGGVTGTSISDFNSIIEGQSYSYIVRAVDQGNGLDESNLVEQTVQAVGPGTGIQTLYSEDFSSPAGFDAWTVLTGPGAHTCGEWERLNTAAQRPSGGSGSFASAVSFECQPLLPRTSTSIDSPDINLDITGLNSATINANVFYDHSNGDDATIEAWNGSAWVVIWSDSNSDFNGPLSLDVTSIAVGNPAFKVRFNYQNANNDQWFSFDDFEIIGNILNPCFTSVSPSSAPNGSGSTQALLGSRLTTSGDSVQVSWDAASCTAANYNLIYGDLASVGSYSLSGSECAIGTGGNFSWSGVPAGDLYFLVVGAEGDAESSWGSGAFGERNGLAASGECAATNKVIDNVCE